MSAKKTPDKKAAPDKPKEKPKTGRPLAVVDPRLVEQLASIGCSLPEMAAACNCSQDTLERRFADEIKKGKENGKTRLRKKQIEVALGGNVVMLIWLGKNMLGQSDAMRTELSGPNGGPIQTEGSPAALTPAAEKEMVKCVAAVRAGLMIPEGLKPLGK